MNAGIFIDSYLPLVDGVVTVVEAYAKRLSEKCNVTIFAPHIRNVDRSYDDRFPYKVERSFALMKKGDDYPQGYPMLDPAYLRKIRNAHLDIIHVHSAYTLGLCAKHFAKKLSIPMVGTIHSHFRPDVRQHVGRAMTEPVVRLMMSIYNSCEECWTVNEVVGDMFRRDYGLKAPTRVMPFSTDHHPVEDREKSRREVNEALGLKGDDFVLCHVGRQDLQKNEEFILRSLCEFKTLGRSFKMLFVGDGSRHEFLRALTSKVGLSDDVIFTGSVNDPEKMMKIYARTDLLLFPSEADTFGLVKIEAACQSTPTLLLEGTMASDGMTDNVNSFMSKPDEKSFAARIMQLQDDRELLARVGEGARRDLFRTWDSLVDDVYDRYGELIDNYRRKHAK